MIECLGYVLSMYIPNIPQHLRLASLFRWDRFNGKVFNLFLVFLAVGGYGPLQLGDMGHSSWGIWATLGGWGHDEGIRRGRIDHG